MIGARLSFTYGAYHWYSNALGRWMATNQVTVNGLTDALILLAVGMVLSRAVRFARVLRETAPVRSAAAGTWTPNHPSYGPDGEVMHAEMSTAYRRLSDRNGRDLGGRRHRHLRARRHRLLHHLIQRSDRAPSLN